MVNEYEAALTVLKGDLAENQNYFDNKNPFVDNLAGADKDEWLRIRNQYDAELRQLRVEAESKAQELADAKAALERQKQSINSKSGQFKDLKSRKAAIQADLKKQKGFRDRVEKEENLGNTPAMWLVMRELETLLASTKGLILEKEELEKALVDLWEEIDALKADLPQKERAVKAAEAAAKSVEEQLKEKSAKREENILKLISPP